MEVWALKFYLPIILHSKLKWHGSYCIIKILLWGKLLRNKYFPYQDLLTYTLKPETSWCWQSIYHGLQQLKQLSIWQVGDGKEINIWRHQWIPNSKGPILKPEELNLSDYQFVTDLIDGDNQTWKTDLLEQLFTPDQVRQILTIPLDLMTKDKIVWPLTSTGHFTTKSAYNNLATTSLSNQLHQVKTPATVWLKLWKLKIPYKLIHFLWKLSTTFFQFEQEFFLGSTLSKKNFVHCAIMIQRRHPIYSCNGQSLIQFGLQLLLS